MRELADKDPGEAMVGDGIVGSCVRPSLWLTVANKDPKHHGRDCIYKVTSTSGTPWPNGYLISDPGCPSVVPILVLLKMRGTSFCILSSAI